MVTLLQKRQIYYRYIKNLAKESLEVNETLLLSLESYSQKEAGYDYK